jgi:nucleotide-binding universal stress UspA family protein
MVIVLRYEAMGFVCLPRLRVRRKGVGRCRVRDREGVPRGWSRLRTPLPADARSGCAEVGVGRVVLAGVDGTDSGRAALLAAAGEAAADGSRLVALHVRRSPLPMEYLAWEAHAFGAQWRDELELEAWLQCTVILGDLALDWEYAVADGSPVQALCSCALARSARAVYVGARIRSGWGARLHRCPADELQRRCPCTVRVVRFRTTPRD